MLAIPLMKSEVAGAFDISPLSRYLVGQQCYNTAQLDQSIRTFATLRGQAIIITEPNDTNEQHLMAYWSQLTAMTPRFPVTVIETEIHLSFPWADAFVSTNRKAIASLIFEQAAIVWNLGALESLRGGRLDRSTDDGARLAAKHFQKAAGLFEHISTVLVPQLPSSQMASSFPCLSVDSLTLAKKLMLAQAQLCFYEKAVRDRKKDQMKSAIIAKLAMEVHHLYAAAATSTRAVSLISVLDVSWNTICEFQSKSFAGAAEYWQGMASKELALQKGSGFGEEVGRYIRAEQHVRAALELARKHNLTTSLTGSSDQLLAAISTNRATALHDLNAIYMEAVVSDANLTEIPPVSMVKATVLAVPACTSDTALFAFVLPKEVITALNHFYDEMRHAFTKYNAEAEESSQIARSSLSSLGLPMSIENAKHMNHSEVALPPALWVKIQDIQQKKVIAHLSIQWEDIEKQNKRAELTLNNIDESLTDAERKDDFFRERFPSYLAEKLCRQNEDIRRNVTVLRTALQSAQQQNEALHRQLSSPELAQLQLSRDELTAQLPQFPVDLLDLDDGSSSAGFHSNEMRELDDKLHEVAALLEERTRQIDQLKEMGTKDRSDDFAAALFSGGSISAVNAKLTAELQVAVNAIHDNLAQQDALLTEIVRLNDIFVQQRQSDATLQARQKYVSELETVAAKAVALQGQLTAGQTFYSNLQAQLTTLQQTADENAYTAQWQRQEFEASLSVVDSGSYVTGSAAPSVLQMPSASLPDQFAQKVTLSGASPSGVAAVPSFAAYPTVGIKPALTPPVPPSSSSSLYATTSTPLPPAAAQSSPAPVYQYNQSSYTVNGSTPSAVPAAVFPTSPTVTAPAPAPHSSVTPATTTAQSGSHPTQYDMETKVARVMEMGFPKDDVVRALSSNNWQEEAAINSLLGIPNSTPQPSAGAHQPPPKPVKPSNGGGFFSWGKK